MTELETVERCDLCGGRELAVRRTWRDQEVAGPERWNLVRCAQCSLHFINPRPSRAAIGAFYPDTYPPHLAAPTQPKPWHRRVAAQDAPPLGAWQRALVHVRQDLSWYRIPAWHGEGRVLDIGCGSGGRYLDILRGLGWTTHGVDPSAPAIATASAHGHNAVVGNAEQQHFPDASMDVVTMWHTLEHTHSPRAALDACFRMLRPGGVLSLCVPNFGSAQAKLLGRFWCSCDAPRHLYQFTRETLVKYLEASGFRVLRVRTRGGPTSLLRSLRYMVNAVFRTKWTRERDWLVTLLDSCSIFASLVRFFGVGSELRVIAERPREIVARQIGAAAVANLY